MGNTGKNVSDAEALEAWQIEVQINAAYANGQYELLVPLAERWLEIHAAHLASTSEKQREILEKLGESILRLWLRDEASEVLEKLLPARKARLNASPSPTVLILNQLAEFHMAQKTADRAEELARRSLSILESIPVASRDLNTFAEAADILAQALDARGEFVEAEKMCRIALAIRDDFHNEPASTAESLSTLGHILLHRGEFDDAERAHTRAVSILETKYGHSHPLVVDKLISMGVFYAHRQQNHKVIETFDKARRILEFGDGPRPPRYGHVLQVLSRAYWTDRQREHAEGFARRAVAFGEECHGPEHHEVAGSLANLAGTLFFSEEALDEAIVLLERAAAIYERAPDGNDQTHLQVLQSLVRRHELNEAFDDAERHGRRALELARERFGAEHVEVATCLALLASVAHRRFDHDAAFEWAEQAVAVRSKYVKENPSDMYDDLMLFGDIQLSVEDFDGARVSFRAAMELVEKALDADPERKGKVLVQCAKAAVYEETPELAVKLLREAADFLSRTFGETDYRLLDVLEDLGGELLQVGDLDGAEAAFQRQLALTDIYFDPGDSRRAVPREFLAGLALRRRDFAHAVQYSEEALAIVVSEFGSDSMRLCTPLDTAADAHVGEHNVERAKELSEWVIRVFRLHRGDDEPEFLKRCERRLAMIEKGSRKVPSPGRPTA